MYAKSVGLRNYVNIEMREERKGRLKIPRRVAAHTQAISFSSSDLPQTCMTSGGV